MTMNLINPAIPEHKVTSVWQRSSRFIVCSFCELRGRQVGDSSLCSNCLIDPVQTRTAIYMQLHNIETQEAKIVDVWLAFAGVHADRWAQIQDSQSLSDYADRCAKHRATGNIYGQLLDAHAAMLAALAPLGIERARLEKALEVIERL